MRKVLKPEPLLPLSTGQKKPEKYENEAIVRTKGVGGSTKQSLTIPHELLLMADIVLPSR